MNEYSVDFDIVGLDLSSWIEECEYTEKILENVQEEKFRALADGQLDIFKKNHEYIKKYRWLTSKKFDEITAYFALNVDKFLRA